MGIQEDLVYENKIVESGIRNIFTPHQPINRVDFFFGRSEEVKKIIEGLNTPGLHCLLYGERGVGKSSLGNIVIELLIQHLYKECHFIKRCDKQTSFEEIFERPLIIKGINIYEASALVKETISGNAGVDFKVVRVGRSVGNEKQITYRPNTVSPSYIAEKLSTYRGVIFIDEFDALSQTGKEKIGELAKLLSDIGSPFKLFIVGVGNSIADLLLGNASTSRNVRQIKLNRMTDSEIFEILDKGSSLTQLIYEETVIRKIIEISAGYPHFAHLLALKAGENAIKSDNSRVEINHLMDSIDYSITDSEEYLQHNWNRTMQTLSSEIYFQILFVCASISSQEIRANVLRKKLTDTFDLDINQNNLNQYLTKLVSDDESHLLHRIAKGVYRFSDPRMPSFVKLKALSIENGARKLK